jgi:hypothetical protein
MPPANAPWTAALRNGGGADFRIAAKLAVKPLSGVEYPDEFASRSIHLFRDGWGLVTSAKSKRGQSAGRAGNCFYPQRQLSVTGSRRTSACREPEGERTENACLSPGPRAVPRAASGPSAHALATSLRDVPRSFGCGPIHSSRLAERFTLQVSANFFQALAGKRVRFGTDFHLPPLAPREKGAAQPGHESGRRGAAAIMDDSTALSTV